MHAITSNIDCINLERWETLDTVQIFCRSVYYQNSRVYIEAVLFSPVVSPIAIISTKKKCVRIRKNFRAKKIYLTKFFTTGIWSNTLHFSNFLGVSSNTFKVRPFVDGLLTYMKDSCISKYIPEEKLFTNIFELRNLVWPQRTGRRGHWAKNAYGSSRVA